MHLKADWLPNVSGRYRRHLSGGDDDDDDDVMMMMI